MENSTRTIYGSALQVAEQLKRPYVIKPFTTLNERFGIQAESVFPENVYPGVGYFAIGNGGHQSVMGADSIPLSKQVQHRATDASLYKPLPFALRATNNDFTPLERSKYGLRRVETWGGQTYYAYYLKRIDLTNVVVDMTLVTVDPLDGTEQPSNFVPSSENLVPTAPVLFNTGTNILTSDYVTCSSRLAISLSALEVKEIMDACLIIRGSVDYAIISEVAICAGVDKVILLEDNTNFNEVVGVQVVSFINDMHQLPYSADGVTSLLDLGTNEPLFNIVAASAQLVAG